jgi:hypothetical protein
MQHTGSGGGICAVGRHSYGRSDGRDNRRTRACGPVVGSTAGTAGVGVVLAPSALCKVDGIVKSVQRVMVRRVAVRMSNQIRQTTTSAWQENSLKTTRQSSPIKQEEIVVAGA